ncbi:efflux RND transporter periplasmic adaptor subunit [Sphingomicrobium clamense]|uniref:Efflux RND transporter periplasmic adaptor subunit n=1 Tax=Sphingomicrobium clamense TaxID=2851013 RepID=A0ABS6V2D4_9SPHN|nr:efflux RND transporter periplasmic adaptor subunit [Sphingomicrobium sp. B8]MBW0143691.1 efflux RND transporter periplasmic adaptor subunit [Sphingomicrobium sp. B8]
MARSLFSRLSLTRHILPVIAMIGVAMAIYFIVVQSPDRSMAEATETPARANGEFAGKPRVAGAGIVEPSSETIEVGTALSGLVEAVLVTPGSVVTKGDPLFRVDTRSLRSRVAELEAAARRAQAAIAEADAARATAARQLDLYRSIDDPAAVSRAEVIRAEGDATSATARRRLAEAELASVRAQLSSARTELGRATVRAPISGEILRVDIRPGELVNAGPGGGGPYIRMGQTNPLHVRIDVDEDEALRVAEGEPAIVSPRGGADTRVEARFVRIEPLVVPKQSLTNSAAERVDVRVMQLIYALPADAGFRVGQQVDAFIPAKEAAAQ